MQNQTICSYVRIKPDDNNAPIQVAEDQKTVILPFCKDTFQFEHAFTKDSTNEEIYNRTTADLIKNSLAGYNCCIFAYGQTCSGKTYTIRGNQQQKGIVQLALQDLFNYDKNEMKIEVRVSYIEIYNEAVNDLLVQNSTNLLLRKASKNSEDVSIEGVTQNVCKTLYDALECLYKGEAFRKYGKTEMNLNSSRSHCIFRIKLNIRSRENASLKQATINIIDLAGSEGISKTKAEGIAKKEGENINKSLLSLSNVIRCLSQQSRNKQQKLSFINFRDSKLTRILQTSLSGNSKTSVICTINCQIQNFGETINTLKFGVSAGQVKVVPKINVVQKNQFSSSKKSFSSIRNLSGSKQNSFRQRNVFQSQEMEQQVSRCRQELSEQKKKNQKLQKQMIHCSRELQSLTNKLQVKESLLQRRDQTIEQLRIDLQIQKEQYSLKLSETRQEIEVLKHDQQNLRNQNMDLQNKNQILLNNQKTYQSNLEKAHKQRNKLQRSHRQERMIMNQQSTKEHLQNMSPKVLQELMNHVIQMLQKNKQIQHLNSRVRELESQLLTMSSQLMTKQESVTSRVSNRKIKHVGKSVSCDIMKQRQMRKQMYIERLRRQNRRLQKQNMEMKMQITLEELGDQNQSVGKKIIEILSNQEPK